VKKMNRKLLAVATTAFTVMMLFSFLAVASAGPPVRKTAEFTVRTAAVSDTLPERIVISDDGITHKFGIIRTVPLESTVNVGTPPVPTVVKNVVLKIDGVPMYGTVRAEVNVKTDPNTGVTSTHYLKWLITFPVQPGVDVEGAFEGVHTYFVDTTPSVTIEGHAVLQGSGGFEGQTLMLKVVYPPGPLVWKGDLLIR
jgi:hypothetical protein